VLKIAYTPDSDDAFSYYAWEHGLVTLEGHDVEFRRHHIGELNQAAAREEYDVIATSSVVYPELADRYQVLATGTSVGRGWGPTLVGQVGTTLAQVRGQKVAVGGHPTTGSVLAQLYTDPGELVCMHYEKIIDAISNSQVAAGVMIHEEILSYEERGLQTVLDFGKAWWDETGLPLPVGLNLVRRDLGSDLARRIATVCYRSLCWALQNPEPAFAFAHQFGRGKARKHVEMFSNRDTLCLPADAREGLRLLLARRAALGMAAPPAAIEFIDPETGAPW
jgi:1,4-dihydroxy-6-naphthoate synthase